MVPAPAISPSIWCLLINLGCGRRGGCSLPGVARGGASLTPGPWDQLEGSIVSPSPPPCRREHQASQPTANVSLLPVHTRAPPLETAWGTFKCCHFGGRAVQGAERVGGLGAQGGPGLGSGPREAAGVIRLRRSMRGWRGWSRAALTWVILHTASSTASLALCSREGNGECAAVQSARSALPPGDRPRGLGTHAAEGPGRHRRGIWCPHPLQMESRMDALRCFWRQGAAVGPGYRMRKRSARPNCQSGLGVAGSGPAGRFHLIGHFPNHGTSLALEFHKISQVPNPSKPPPPLPPPWPSHEAGGGPSAGASALPAPRAQLAFGCARRRVSSR